MSRKSGGFVYGVIKSVLFILYKLFFCFRAYGAENVPLGTAKGLILAPNHDSYLDPPLVGIAIQRRVTYLAKEYLFRAFIVGWTLRSIGAFPIRTQKDDFRSMRELIRLLKDGACVVVFPEGTRSADGVLREAELGVGFLALKSGAEVQPVYIEGTREAFPRHAKFFKPHAVSVHYGRPFLPAADESIASAENPYSAVGNRIMREIAALKEAAAKNLK